MAPTTRNSRSPTPAGSRKRSRETSPTPATGVKKQRQNSPKVASKSIQTSRQFVPTTTKPPKTKPSRSTRAQSLPISSRTRSAQSSTSPRKKPKDLEFSLNPINPSTTLFCRACNAKIPTTPEVNAPARTLLESQLMSSILQARGRVANIESAYANAKQEFIILGNQDESFNHSYISIPPDPSLTPKDNTKGRTDKDDIPLE